MNAVKSAGDNNNGSLTLELKRQVIRAGPWAALTLLLLGFAGQRWREESNEWRDIRTYAIKYIEQSTALNKKLAENNESLLKNMDELRKLIENQAATLERIERTMERLGLILTNSSSNAPRFEGSDLPSS